MLTFIYRIMVRQNIEAIQRLMIQNVPNIITNYIYVEMRIIVRVNTEAIQRLMIQNVPNIITNYFTRRWQT